MVRDITASNSELLRLAPLIVSMTRRMGHGRLDGDALQDAYLDVLIRLRQGREETSEKAAIRAMAAGLKRRRNADRLRTCRWPVWDAIADRPPARPASTTVCEQFRRLRSKLTEKHVLAIILKRFDRRPLAEVAELLDITPQRVQTLVQNGLKLALEMAPQLERNL